MNRLMAELWIKLKQCWVQSGYKIDTTWLNRVKWMNSPARPNAAYIPTTVEHCANVFTHGVWVVPSVLCLFNLLDLSNSFVHYWSALVYGFSLISIFTVSTFFHSVFFCSHDTHLKEVLHRCDRAMIYIFIAGSYFPWIKLRPCPGGSWAAHLDWGVWVLACLGIIYQQLYHERYKKLETIFYFVMGVLPAALLLSYWTDSSGLLELELGGVLYSVGVVFFKLDGKLPFAHAIWHLFVAAAALVHYHAITNYLYHQSATN